MPALLFLIFLAGSSGAAFGDFEQKVSIVGRWQFYKKIYHGQEMPEGPEATLRLFYEFSPNGESHLWWWHEGDRDHCSRKGYYQIKDGFLEERVFWVDPQNSIDCSSDPDMQPHRFTRTPIFFLGEDFALQFHLGEDELDLVWKRLL